MALKNIEALYLPKRSDKLAITLDWAKTGIGATLFALLKDKKPVVAYFNCSLAGNQPNWAPCDGEGLAACMAIDKFAPYIRESSHPTLVCSDSKPVVQAVHLLMHGFFSTSQRLNRLLSNCNTFPIQFHHLSGKSSLNKESDSQSRYTISCQEKNCPVCSFISKTSDTLDKLPTVYRETPRKFLQHVPIENSFVEEKACSESCHTCAFLHTMNPDFSKSLEQNFEIKAKKATIKPQEFINGSKQFHSLETGNSSSKCRKRIQY